MLGKATLFFIAGADEEFFVGEEAAAEAIREKSNLFLLSESSRLLPLLFNEAALGLRGGDDGECEGVEVDDIDEDVEVLTTCEKADRSPCSRMRCPIVERCVWGIIPPAAAKRAA